MSTTKKKSEEGEVLFDLKKNKPLCKNKFDLLAISIHSYFNVLGFKNVDGNQWVQNDWNNSSDSYTFNYSHPKTKNTFTVKCLVLGEKLLVHALYEKKNCLY